MISFKNDYSEGAHPNILQTLIDTNLVQQNGYGEDEYSLQAKELIKVKIKNPDAEVYFTSGGTQANLIVISALLRPYESVISASSGHIHVHEAGAIEATGHKINVAESSDGKVTVEQIQKILDEHTTVPHMVKPKMVYISNSTEIGTIYTKSELEQLFSFCKSKGLILFMDGARIGSAVCAKGSDLSLQDISRLTDIFYIGATKNGGLLGEAIVINNPAMQSDFAFNLKQRGALLAKGRILGIQFLELFKDDLFFQFATHANDMAEKISNAVSEKGYTFLTQSTSNQIFPILPNELIEQLSKKYAFYIWQKVDEQKSAVRLVTSWATRVENVEAFVQDLK